MVRFTVLLQELEASHHTPLSCVIPESSQHILLFNVWDLLCEEERSLLCCFIPGGAAAWMLCRCYIIHVKACILICLFAGEFSHPSEECDYMSDYMSEWKKTSAQLYCSNAL